MKERFKRTEPVDQGVRRIAVLELDAALAAARSEGKQQAMTTAVHEVRKRCKKLRALLRLVRGSFDGYAAEQALLRDTARGLSALRDGDARHEALQRLVQRYPGRLDGELLRNTRDLANLGTPPDRRARLRAALDRTADALTAQRARVDGWQLDAEGFDALAAGLERTYRDGRRALAALGDEPPADAMHTLRKAVKYQRHQLGYLGGSWPGPLKALSGEAETLADLLGQHHDIAVLHGHLQQVGDDAEAIRDFAAVVATELRRLEDDARPLAQRLYAEPKAAFVARLRCYWDAWRA